MRNVTHVVPITDISIYVSYNSWSKMLMTFNRHVSFLQTIKPVLDVAPTTLELDKQPKSNHVITLNVPKKEYFYPATVYFDQ